MEKKTTLAEKIRLAEDVRREKNWKRWGPYLSERQWGTVREDYSPLGEVWDYFPHDHARSRAYRWGEDGLLGLTDRQGRLAFAMALWNGRDSILKERLFGLSGPEGNHGEDVKELYYYLDSSPTHSYMKALYKYPHDEYPYRLLVEENLKRGNNEPEFELVDTDIFNDNRYFDVWVEYAKASPNDVLIRIKIANRSSGPADLHLLPTIWFRNTWSWGREGEAYWPKPCLRQIDKNLLQMDHASLNRFYFAVSAGPDNEYPSFLFTENETNTYRLFNESNSSLYVKDAFHEYVINARKEAVNPEKKGTKATAVYHLNVAAQTEIDIRCRLFSEKERPENFFDTNFEKIFNQRIKETDEFYLAHTPQGCTEEERRILRQAKAGLLWTKQFYHYSVKDWLEGDPTQPKPPESHKYIRNQDWQHLYNRDVISMPDKWEYPWYAAWDLAFHMIPFANIDPHFTKEQLILFLREWYMHPNGQLPAYEFAFSDVNPPVHAWAAWRVYKMTAPQGKRDRLFLARVFQKLLLNFTWWVNRKDNHGHHIFSGGFLGLDNIGVFDRSKPLPTGGHLEQADGTAWMAFYCATMLSIALELAREDPAYEDSASKFFEHFIAIIRAINHLDGTGLWDEEDGFYYDHLHIDDRSIPLRIRSMVGLIPLIAVEVVESTVINNLLGFKKRMNWFLNNLKDLAQLTTCMVNQEGELGHRHRLLAIPSRQRLIRILHYLLDEDEFLSPFGIRSLSKAHRNNPFVFRATGYEYRVEYSPGESNTSAFGGNSNWRGPIWFPVNYLLIEALERYNHFYGDTLRVECPTGSGRRMNLAEVAKEITGRLTSIFLPDQTGRRPCHGDLIQYAEDPHWRQLLLFYEYFHGDNGSGVGASHQTGWTALITRWIEDIGKSRA